MSECSHGRFNCAIFFSSVLARRKGSGWRVTVFILLFSTLCHSPCHYLILNLSWVFFHTDVLIYNVVLLSGVQPSDSGFQILFH